MDVSLTYLSIYPAANIVLCRTCIVYAIEMTFSHISIVIYQVLESMGSALYFWLQFLMAGLFFETIFFN